MLWVQLVEILYTKASRGAPAATRRNQLPRAFPVTLPVDAMYGFEKYRCSEWGDFVPTMELAESSEQIPHGQGDLVIEVEKPVVLLGLRWNSATGQPARRDRLRAIELRKGQTARLVVNGRYASYSGQIYTEATYNVAFGEGLQPEAFERDAFDRILDMRADLL
jgi:hypothetical protein